MYVEEETTVRIDLCCVWAKDYPVPYHGTAPIGSPERKAWYKAMQTFIAPYVMSYMQSFIQSFEIDGGDAQLRSDTILFHQVRSISDVKPAFNIALVSFRCPLTAVSERNRFALLADMTAGTVLSGCRC